jgi:hypothetical protein
MHLNFRQGIVRFQTDVYANPEFLMKSSQSGNYVDLIVSPDPTIITFAHKNATYLVQENKTVRNAWGPFTGNVTRYLYWDISLLDGSLSRGFTTLPQIISGSAPVDPAPDQHWFDTSNQQMKIWGNGKWLDKIRVFAAVYSSQAVLQPFPLGTQIGSTGNGSFDAGNILLDFAFKPLRQSNGTFATSTTNIALVNGSTQQFSLASAIVVGMAEENVPQFSFVQKTKSKNVKLARSNDPQSKIFGVVTEDLYTNEVGMIQTSGLIQNEQWDWQVADFGRPVFCGLTGEIVLTPPAYGVLQIAGYVYDNTSILLNIQSPIIIKTTADDNLKVICVSPTTGEFISVPKAMIGGGDTIIITPPDEPDPTPGGIGDVVGYQHVQSSASTTWTITHSKNTRNVQVTIWDSANEQIIAGSVKITNENTVTVKFNTAITGRAILMLFS